MDNYFVPNLCECYDNFTLKWQKFIFCTKHSENTKNSFRRTDVCRFLSFNLLKTTENLLNGEHSNESSTFHSNWHLSINEPVNLLAFIVHLVIFFKIQFFSYSLSLSVCVVLFNSIFVNGMDLMRGFICIWNEECAREKAKTCASAYISRIPLNNVHFHYDLQPLLRCRFEFLIPFFNLFSLNLSLSISPI